MKKISIVLLTFSLFTGIISAAEPSEELVNARTTSAPELESGSINWGRVRQRVGVGAVSTVAALTAVKQLGAEKVLGVTFGLSAAMVPALWREQKINWNELFGRAGKRKEILITAFIGTPLNIVERIVCDLSLPGNEDEASLIAIAASTVLCVTMLNNALEDRGAYLEQLCKANCKQAPEATAWEKHQEERDDAGFGMRELAKQ